MSAPPKGKGALLHAPIPVNSVPNLAAPSPEVKRFPAKFTSNRFQSDTYGPPELCAWAAAPGLFWIQTRDKSYARKLRRRNDTRKVGICGHNCFQETYEMAGTWRKVKRLISRYISVTPDHILAQNRGYNASDLARRVNSADLPIPVGLVTPDQVSATTKISKDAPAYGSSGRKRRSRQVTIRRASSRAAK
jgi:hypothetical protein